jgi:hypothetical protein
VVAGQVWIQPERMSTVDLLLNSDPKYAWFAETICDLPSVTSIVGFNRQRLQPIQRDTPLFIDDGVRPDSKTIFFVSVDDHLAGGICLIRRAACSKQGCS